jgi:beta-galactosidase
MGQVIPVHVFTSGDEGELFLNNRSLGRKKKGQYEYRLRWDSVLFEPGTLRVVTYKNGKPWATDTVKSADAAARLQLVADRSDIKADGKDLSFITLRVTDDKGNLTPDWDNNFDNMVTFSITGPGEIVATDNGDAADLESFASHNRKPFKGLALVIVRAKGKGSITVTASSQGLPKGKIVIRGK